MREEDRKSDENLLEKSRTRTEQLKNIDKEIAEALHSFETERHKQRQEFYNMRSELQSLKGVPRAMTKQTPSPSPCI